MAKNNEFLVEGLYSVHDVACALYVTAEMIHAWILNDNMPAYSIEGTYCFSEAMIEKWVTDGNYEKLMNKIIKDVVFRYGSLHTKPEVEEG